MNWGEKPPVQPMDRATFACFLTVFASKTWAVASACEPSVDLLCFVFECLRSRVLKALSNLDFDVGDGVERLGYP